uniref:MSP domain-containing protein n=1 Tax=Caenorhabditis tropicalis TaxID=1561998 RepID=A0A1I7UXE9_9PELO
MPHRNLRNLLVVKTRNPLPYPVKTSDNLLYRVNPVFGFVEPGEKLSIDVLRHNGAEKTDHLVVLTADVNREAVCAKGIFDASPPRELTVVPLVAH